MSPPAAPDDRRADMRGWAFWWPILLMAAVPVLAHLPEAGGWVTCNPLYGATGLMAAPPRHILAGSCTIDGNVGGTLQALGGAAANAWLAGTVPWWTPDLGLGLPLAAEAQPAAFFMPFVLLLHASAGVVLLKLIMQVLSGLFTFAVLRALELGRFAASVGGGAFALNGSFAWFGHSMILPIAFLPALVFGLERSRRQAALGQAGGTIWIALGLAYSLLAGFPETAFMDGLLAGVWAVTALFRVPAGRRVALAGKIMVGGCAGLALSAPAWICFLDLLQDASVASHAFVRLNHFSAGQAAALLFPSLFGPPYRDIHLTDWTDDGGYFGPGIACLALVSLCGGVRLRGMRLALAGWIVFWLCAFFGETLCHAVWAGTPVLNQVQMTRYGMPSMEFAAAVLAALAADDWRRGKMPAPRAWTAAALTIVLACAVLLLAARAERIAWGNPVSCVFVIGSLIEAAIVVGIIVAWLAYPPRRAGAAILATALLLDAGLHFALPELAGYRPERQALGAVDYLQRHAAFTRVYSVKDQVPLNYGALFGFDAIQADMIPAPLAWEDAAKRIGGGIDASIYGLGFLTSGTYQVAALRASAAQLEAADVGYVVTASADDPFAADKLPGMALTFDDGHSRVYTVPHAPYAEARGAPCRLRIESRLRQEADCAAPATLLRRELWLTGWHARINGEKATIYQADGMFQSVALPAGHAGIVWAYRPPHARTMAVLSALGAVTIIALGLGALFRRAHRFPAPPTGFPAAATAFRQRDR